MPKVNVVSRVLVVIGFIALSASLAHAGGGAGGGGASLEGFKCYLVAGVHQARVLTLDDQFGTEEKVRLGAGRLLCTPVIATVVEGPELDLFPAGAVPDHFKCYSISSRPFNPSPVVTITDQFDVETLDVLAPQFLCTNAVKEIVTP